MPAAASPSGETAGGSSSTTDLTPAPAPATPGPSQAAEQPLEDPEVVRQRQQRRKRTIVRAIVLAGGYYGFAILYYTNRAKKQCREQFNAGDQCSKPCLENWNSADAIYFATVTMTSVGYGDLKPSSDESKVVTIMFLIFGFTVRRRCPNRHRAIPCRRLRRDLCICSYACEAYIARAATAVRPEALCSASRRARVLCVLRARYRWFSVQSRRRSRPFTRRWRCGSSALRKRC